MSSWLMWPESLYDLLAYSLYATEVALVILLVKQFFREQLSAKWHFNIWIILLIRLVVPPEKLDWIAGPSITQLLDPQRVIGALHLGIDGFRQAEVSNSALFSGHSGMYQANNADIVLMTGESLEHLPKAVFDTPAVFQGSGPFENQFQQTALTIYFVIVGLLLLYFIGTYCVLRLRLRRGKDGCEELKQQIDRCKERLEMKRKIGIRLSDQFDSPFVCGILFPLLVVPASMEKGIDDKIILHELIHVKHKHVAVNWLLNTFRCIHFFNPILWYTFSRIQNDCELRCDEQLLTLYGSEASEDHQEYGTLLLTAMKNRRNMMPGTSCLSNGQKNILHRIRRIRDFWKLSGASGCIGFLLTLIIGVYCLSNGGAAYTLKELPSAFAFSTAAFDYNTYYGERYKIKSPLEAAYGYGLALTEWEVSYEWIYLTDEERQERRDKKEINEETGTNSRKHREFKGMDNQLVNAVSNGMDDARISIYNLCRGEDGVYRAILRIKVAGISWTEDHIITIGVREGRYQVLSDETLFYMMPLLDNEEIPLPYHAAFYKEQDGEKTVAVDYRMNCQTTFSNTNSTYSTHTWTKRHIPNRCVEEIRTAADGPARKSVLNSVPGPFEEQRSFPSASGTYVLTESYGYTIDGSSKQGGV